MPRWDAQSAECLVFTFKEGLLSPIAHDLKIRVTAFELEIEEGLTAVRARFDAASLRVVCARKGGADAEGALSPAERREIEENIVKEVLDSRRHPEIRFTSSSVAPDGSGVRVTGSLSLHGQERTLSTRVVVEEGRWVAEVQLHQPDFGIRPYRALLGTLKIKPDVTVRLSVPIPVR